MTATKRSSTLSVGTRPANPDNTRPSRKLDVFANPNPKRDYLIHMQIEEFTCLCPLTGQPDFARLCIDYIPDLQCVELKSLKLYLWSFRDVGVFHEALTNRILDDLAESLAPRFIRLLARWNVRGGIFTDVLVEHRQKKWKPAARVELADFPTESATR